MNMPEEEEGVSWIIKTADAIEQRYPKGKLILNGGLSVRGPQHIGRLRGEVFIQANIAEVLRRRGRKVSQCIILYNDDAMKPTGLANAFPNDPEKQRKFAGMRLFDLPDPVGSCHPGWVDHFWEDFGGYIDQFGVSPEIVKTHDFYQMAETKRWVGEILERRAEVRELANVYRERKPWPEDWIPLNPLCTNCGSIAHTKTTDYNLKTRTVSFTCSKCGASGESPMAEGKLWWRLEWPLMWKVLGISFEAYGKDHAAAGGSRESCAYFYTNFFKEEPPMGFPYEWVSLKVKGKDLGEMSASEFVGITPKEWLRIAPAEVLRYRYARTRPSAGIALDLDNLHVMVDEYLRSQRIVTGKEAPRTDKELANLKDLFGIINPEMELLPDIPYAFAATLGQVYPLATNFDVVRAALMRTGHMTGQETEEQLRGIKKYLGQATTWALEYAPESIRLRVLTAIDPELRARIKPEERAFLHDVGGRLKDAGVNSKTVDTAIREAAAHHGLDAKKAYALIYMPLLGRDSGPRAAMFLPALGEKFVVERLLSI